MTLLAYVYPHPTTPTPRKRKGWERALLPLSLFWKPGGGVFWVGECSHMALNLRGGVGMDIFWNHKIYLSMYYIPFLHSHKKKLHFFIRATTWGLGLQNTDQRFVWNCPPILDLFYCACSLEKMVRKVHLPCKLDGSVLPFKNVQHTVPKTSRT